MFASPLDQEIPLGHTAPVVETKTTGIGLLNESGEQPQLQRCGFFIAQSSCFQWRAGREPQQCGPELSPVDQLPFRPAAPIGLGDGGNKPHLKANTMNTTALVFQNTTFDVVDRIVFPQPEVGTHCMVDGIGEWTGFLIGGDEALIAWMRQNPNVRDPESIRRRLGRLMEEAGRLLAKAEKDANDVK